jgi:hypothetical protein
MSEFTAIRAVTRTLQTLLQQHITDSPDPQLQGVPISLSSLKELRDAATPPNPPNGISLWRYCIARNADLLNQLPERVDDQTVRQPLPVDLYYLVAPITANRENEQVLLGRVLQLDHEAGEPDELSLAILDSGADLVIAGCEAVDEAEFGRLLRERPKAKVLAVVGDGRRSYLYQLRAHSMPLGEMSPERMLTVLTTAASGHDPDERQ